MPWRNGLGVTLEIAREPAAPADFSWRLSLATVANSGPFSNFSGYQRSVTLIDGRGFDLQVDRQAPIALRSVGASARFSGAATAVCTLIDAACTDLSLMVQEPGCIGSVSVIRCAVETNLPPSSSAMQALFCLQGEALVVQRNSSAQLLRHDTVITACEHPVAIRAASSTVALLLRLEWRNQL